MCSELTMKRPEWSHWRRPVKFNANFEFIKFNVIEFEQVTISW